MFRSALSFMFSFLARIVKASIVHGGNPYDLGTLRSLEALTQMSDTILFDCALSSW